MVIGKHSGNGRGRQSSWCKHALGAPHERPEQFSKQIDFSEEDIKHVIEFLKYDKKNTSDEPLFVLLNEIGKPSYDNKVSNKEIIEAFKFYAV